MFVFHFDSMLFKMHDKILSTMMIAHEKKIHTIT